jgi:hypothetical protein
LSRIGLIEIFSSKRRKTRDKQRRTYRLRRIERSKKKRRGRNWKSTII